MFVSISLSLVLFVCLSVCLSDSLAVSNRPIIIIKSYEWIWMKFYGGSLGDKDTIA